jgi:hypothetical protein
VRAFLAALRDPAVRNAIAALGMRPVGDDTATGGQHRQKG